MDCPTEPTLSNLIDESTAMSWMGDRFDPVLFRQKLREKEKEKEGNSNSSLTMTLERFRSEVDRADVYFLFDWEGEREKDREESIVIARHIQDLLKKKGVVCWFDVGNHELIRGVHGSESVIVLITKSYIDRVCSNDPNDRCKKAFNLAVSKKSLGTLIPVVLESSLLDPLSWPGEIGKMFAGRRHIDMTGDITHTGYLEDRVNYLYDFLLQVIKSPLKLKQNQSRSSDSNRHQNCKELSQLTVTEVSCLLSRVKLSNYCDTFLTNEIDGLCLSVCRTEEDIKELGVTLLPKARVFFNLLQDFHRDGVPLGLISARHGIDDSSHGISGSPQDGSSTTQANANGTASSTTTAATQSSSSTLSITKLQSVRVSGCTGDRAHDINGIYDPTEEMHDGFCRYLKRGGQNNWIEYNSTRGHWHIKKAESKGTVNAWAYAVSPCLAPDLIDSTSVWHVYNGFEFPEQPELQVTRVYESFMVRGATGTCAQQVNGIFDPTNETCGGWIRYRKRGGQDSWVEYSEVRGQWHIKPSASKNTTNAWAYMVCKPVCSPEKQKGSSWHLYDGNKFDKQETVLALPEAIPICIKGATGSCMNQVNGIFDPTEEVYGGFVRYRKRGGQDCWMEYNEMRKQWHIKPEASKTTTNAWAYAVYPSPIAPHKRRGIWHLYDGSQFEKQAEVIVMPELKPVIISGATGNVAPQLNGIFDPTDELCNGWVRYRKRGGQDCWMEYMESKGQWHIKPSASKRSTNAWAYATCRPVHPPQEIGDIWRLYDGTKFEDHSNVMIMAEPDDESRELARWLREIQNSTDL